MDENRIPRYAFDGGFTVSFYPKNRVKIEIVYAGFDCRETRRHIWHKRFIIPWNSIWILQEVDTLEEAVVPEYISIEKYRKLAKNRLSYLVDSLGYDVAKVLDFLPMKEYTAIGTVMEKVILEEVIKPELDKIEHQPVQIHGDIIAGHIVRRNKPQPSS